VLRRELKGGLVSRCEMTLVTHCVHKQRNARLFVNKTKRVVDGTKKRVPHFSRTLREVGPDHDIDGERRHRSKVVDGKSDLGRKLLVADPRVD